MKKKKKGGKGDLLYYLAIVVLLCVIALSLFQIYLILDKYQEGTKAYNTLSTEVQESETKDPLDINWDKLLKKNQDVKAWLYAKDTKINYPVAQGEDNDFYLHHLLDGSYDFKGTLFIDYRVEKPFSNFVTVIYGHAMRDGTMFKPLFKWKEQDFYDDHKVILMATKKHKYELEIFSVKYMMADDEHYNPVIEKGDRDSYLEFAKKDSLVETDVEVTNKDKIVMLSTCAESSGDRRVVVYAKLVRTE